MGVVVLGADDDRPAEDLRGEERHVVVHRAVRVDDLDAVPDPTSVECGAGL